jgi:hypothetical protein
MPEFKIMLYVEAETPVKVTVENEADAVNAAKEQLMQALTAAGVENAIVGTFDEYFFKPEKA